MELILAIGLIIIAHHMRKAQRQPQTIRLEMHHFVHLPPDGPGELLPKESAPSADNVVPFRRIA